MEKVTVTEGSNKSILHTLLHLQLFDLYLLLHKWNLNAKVGNQSEIFTVQKLFCMDSKLFVVTAMLSL